MSQVRNPAQGTIGALAYELTLGNTPAQQITVWVGPPNTGPVTPHIIKGIKVTWSGGVSETVAGNITNSTSYDFTFGNNDRVSLMRFYTVTRINRIQLSTVSGRQFERGGTGGTQRIQDVGDGILLGFWGTYNPNQELTSIGSVFQLSSRAAGENEADEAGEAAEAAEAANK